MLEQVLDLFMINVDLRFLHVREKTKPLEDLTSKDIS